MKPSAPTIRKQEFSASAERVPFESGMGDKMSLSCKIVALAGTILLFFGGCSAPPAILAVKPTLRFGYPTEADTADVPSLMAQELLKAQGYTVERHFFASPDVEVAAFAKGDIDLDHGSTRTHWAAAAKDADIVILSEQAGDVWQLVTRPELKMCADLDKQKIGVNSAGSISNALLQAYVKQNCPDSAPESIFLSGSENRAAALQAGELDGAMLELADVLEFERQAPGKFNVLLNFAKALPALKTNGIYTSHTFAQAHPDAVRDYLRAIVQVHRAIRQNPQTLYDAMVKYLKMDAATAGRVGEAYLAANVWDVNGGLKAGDAAYSADFFAQMGSIPEGMDAAKLEDLTYLNQVLDEIGRK